MLSGLFGLLGSSTAKAQASAVVTLLGTVLAASLPMLDGFWSNLALVVLAVLGSYGLTYAVPNTKEGRHS